MEAFGRLLEGSRVALDVGFVARSGDGIGVEVEAVGHALHACGQARRRGEIGVDVGAGQPGLQACRRWSTRNRPECHGPVVHTPGGSGGSPVALDQPLVAVHSRRQHRQQVPEVEQLACQVGPEHRTHRVRRVGVEERCLAGVDPHQALVVVPGTSRQVRRDPRHERRHHPQTGTDLLRRGLEQHCSVGGLHRVSVEDGRFEHTGAGLGVQSLERHPVLAELAHEGLEELRVVGMAQHAVAEHSGADRVESPITLGLGRLRCLGEVEPLELEAEGGLVAGIT